VLDYGQQTPLEMYRFTCSRQRSLFGAGFEVWAGHEPFCTGSSQLVWNLTGKSIGDSLTVLDYGQQKTPERYWSTYVPSGFCEWPPDELAKKSTLYGELATFQSCGFRCCSGRIRGLQERADRRNLPSHFAGNLAVRSITGHGQLWCNERNGFNFPFHHGGGVSGDSKLGSDAAYPPLLQSFVVQFLGLCGKSVVEGWTPRVRSRGMNSSHCR
jgi:hypothetical protein